MAFSSVVLPCLQRLALGGGAVIWAAWPLLVPGLLAAVVIDLAAHSLKGCPSAGASLKLQGHSPWSSLRQQLSRLIKERHGKGVLKGDLLSQRTVAGPEHVEGRYEGQGRGHGGSNLEHLAENALLAVKG